jgi:hypothetical protein
MTGALMACPSPDLGFYYFVIVGYDMGFLEKGDLAF